MKHPRHGIRRTSRLRKSQPAQPIQLRIDVPVVPPPVFNPPQEWMLVPDDFPLPQGVGPNIVAADDKSIANVFCYSVLADKRSGVVYNDLTGNFPFVSFDGSVCFLVVYHYKANAILAPPISGLDDKSIFNAYKQTFDKLTQKGFKPKLNVMDNQATRYIKTFLTEQECELQLVEPHNHRVNAAERAIQTFKDAFISALATTDKDFPLQLWDKLTPQVILTLNMMRASRIDPTKSAHEVIHGKYDWNRYPLAPLGCRAVVYKDGDTRGSWASRGVDGWYLGPSQDHYSCDIYYIPDTRGYRVSGSTELFPQHCQLPDMSPHQHFCALVNEMSDDIDRQSLTPKGRRILALLRDRIHLLLAPPPTPEEQKVRLEEQRMNEQLAQEREQRVVDDTPIITIPRITEAPGIIHSQNPTAKRFLKETPRVHCRVTRNNTPGIVATPIVPAPYVPIPSGAQRRMVTRHAINLLMESEKRSCQRAFTPTSLLPPVVLDDPSHLEHFCSPMVHPITGETISSYKKLMHDPVTAKTWQTAFGKDFGGMTQGDDKTGQKGTNAMFVMSHKEIRRAYEMKKKFTYGNPVIDYRPKKEDPHRIRITAGGNLITYESSPSVRTADLDTAKLHWNSVISTPGAQYMCLDIKNFYLTAKLDYYEYMRMPLDLFPAWIKKQYNLIELAYEGYVHLEMRCAVWGLPQAGILANKKLRRKLAPFGYFEHPNTPGLWKHVPRPISFTLVVDDFGVKYTSDRRSESLSLNLE